jgi:hypothetical protein
MYDDECTHASAHTDVHSFAWCDAVHACTKCLRTVSTPLRYCIVAIPSNRTQGREASGRRRNKQNAFLRSAIVTCKCFACIYRRRLPKTENSPPPLFRPRPCVVASDTRRARLGLRSPHSGPPDARGAASGPMCRPCAPQGGTAREGHHRPCGGRQERKKDVQG